MCSCKWGSVKNKEQYTRISYDSRGGSRGGGHRGHMYPPPPPPPPVSSADLLSGLLQILVLQRSLNLNNAQVQGHNVRSDQLSAERT